MNLTEQDKPRIAAAARKYIRVLEGKFPDDGKKWAYHIYRAGDELRKVITPDVDYDPRHEHHVEFEGAWDRGQRVAVMEVWRLLVSASEGWAYPENDPLKREKRIGLLTPLAKLASQARRGAPCKYPKMIDMAIDLLGDDELSERAIYRKCKEAYPAEAKKVPAKVESFMRRVRSHARKRKAARGHN